MPKIVTTPKNNLSICPRQCLKINRLLFQEFLPTNEKSHIFSQPPCIQGVVQKYQIEYDTSQSFQITTRLSIMHNKIFYKKMPIIFFPPMCEIYNKSKHNFSFASK